MDIWSNGNKTALIDTSGLYTIELSDGTTNTQRCIFTYFPAFDQIFVGTMFESFSLANENSHDCPYYSSTEHVFKQNQ